MAPRKTFALLCRYCFFVLLCSYATTAHNSTSGFILGNTTLINCGSNHNNIDDGGRAWQGDVDAKFLIPGANSSSVATDSPLPPDVPSVPFRTARILTGPTTYSIPVSPDRKFVRLYFYPTAYDGRSASDAVFDVSAAYEAGFVGYTLFRNFSPARYVEALNVKFIVREYSLNVSGWVNLTFTPSTTHVGAYAFVNGIEVISMPDIFSMQRQPGYVSMPFPYTPNPTTAVETMYRLNVGGQAVAPEADSGLFRQWDDDPAFIFGAFGLTHPKDSNITLNYSSSPMYAAPDSVYWTQRSMTPYPVINRQINLTWLFSIDPGFNYLLRLHFCEIQSIYDKPNKRVFSININGVTADKQVDVFAYATEISGDSNKGLGVPFFKDYVTFIKPADDPSVDFRLDLHPSEETKPDYVDAVLNGLELFKFYNLDGNLAPNPLNFPPNSINLAPKPHNRGSNYKKAGVSIGISVSVIVVICVFMLVLFAKRKWNRRNHNFGKEPFLSIHPDTSHRFTFGEIQEATKGFDHNLVIGAGGFGKVYKGVIRTKKPTAGDVAVAIKRANPTSKQGIREFLNEIEMLSKLRHRHLVPFIGFCNDRGEMILVYEYMANGTLREHLYNNSGTPTLGWRQRLQVCIGAASGLHYLHTGTRYSIIHRDVKTTNILLDGAWIAKVADFGLCKAGPEMERRNIDVSTAVKGSFGYLDPEYFRRQKLTDKSDVYSFGVVLFEVLCSRPAVNADLPLEQANLAEWARLCHENGELEKIVDPRLKGQIAPDCFIKFIETASKCISDNGQDRPSMGDVLWSLESALQLQDDFHKEPGSSTTTASCISGTDSTSIDTNEFTTNAAIFSEIADPKGR